MVRKAKEQRPGAWVWRRPDEAEMDGQRIRRWIGAARRRASRTKHEEPGMGAQVITLTWAQTFGRPLAPRLQGDAGERIVIPLRRR